MHNLAVLYALHSLWEFEAPGLPVQPVIPEMAMEMVTPEMDEMQELWVMLVKLEGTVQEQRYGKGPAVYQQEKADQADSAQPDPDPDSALASRYLGRTRQIAL